MNEHTQLRDAINRIKSCVGKALGWSWEEYLGGPQRTTLEGLAV